MARRLVLSVKGGEISYSDILEFTKAAEKVAIKRDQVVTVSQVGDSILFGVAIPDDRMMNGEKKPQSKKKTKKQIAVEKQIQEHREKKKRGEAEAYVPPVGRKSPPKSPRVKCPSCNIRKHVTKNGSINVIKPHTAKGKPCPGSGLQVTKVGRSWKVAEHEGSSN